MTSRVPELEELPTPLRQRIIRANENFPHMSEQERAREEADIWTEATGVLRGELGCQGLHKRECLGKWCGSKTHDLEARSMLLFLGPAAKPFWSRLDNGEMSHATAERLCREVRVEMAKHKKQRLGLDEDVVVANILKEYDANPASRTASGHIVRKKPTTSLPKLKTLQPEKKRKPIDPEKPRAFWSQLREDIAKYIAPSFAGLDPIIQEKLYFEFERDLKALLAEYGQKISRVSREERGLASLNQQVNRRQIIDACQTLCVEPPGPGKPIDFMKARKNKKKLAAEYHPDHTGGSEATRPQYEAVIAAFEVVERYAEQNGMLEKGAN